MFLGMKINCPNSDCPVKDQFIKDGIFFRKDDSHLIQRFRCKACGKKFSKATFSDTYRQKRRRINGELLGYLASNMSQKRAAFLLGVHHTTVERRFRFLAMRARRRNDLRLKKLKGRVFNIQIDDLITKENSKLKPLTVSIAVDVNRRLILGAEVSQIPAFGHLSKIALKKYGFRKDEHYEGLERLFNRIKFFANREVLVRSDEHQRYPAFVREYLPKAKHETFKSERAHVAGQGELKKVAHDPLFIINHTCALLRANVNRLIRKTWCTTKNKDRLQDHLDIFIYFHNRNLNYETS